MTEPGLVDWSLAASLAGTVAGDPAEGRWRQRPDRARAIAGEALERALAYTGLVPESPVPPAEVVTRDEWIAANVRVMRELAAPLERRAAGEITLPRPLAGLARRALGAAAGAEAGIVLGYASRRVLGQYQVDLTAAVRPPRLLLVGSNLTATASELGLDEEGFLRWVAIHEQAHAIQFAAVPWLRDHLAGLLARLLDGAATRIDVAALVSAVRRLLGTDPRRALARLLRGELARALAGPSQGALLDELQATMAVVEGHAEHVMDAAARDDRRVAAMRERFDERRARRGLGDAIARALGLGMKLRQYELGKGFADAVTARGGIGLLNRVWERPEALPGLAELERPDEWLARVAPAGRARSAPPA